MRRQLTSMLLGFALIATSLAARSSGRSPGETQPLKVTVELISQKYCWSDSGKAFSMMFKIHMRFVNQTDRKLIVLRGFGHGMFWVVIAADAAHFSGKDYEYNPDVNWSNFFVGPDGKEPNEELDSPGSGFAIVPPGESVQDENEYWTSNLGPAHGFPMYRGALQPGSHVVGVSVNTWPYHATPEEIHKRWEPFGDLIYKNVLVGPLQFTLPADPKIEKCEQ